MKRETTEVKTRAVQKLFDLANEVMIPEAALEACDERSDEDIADLLELFDDAEVSCGHKPSALIRSAIRRLRKESIVREAPKGSNS